jgi:hypothetical protein
MFSLKQFSFIIIFCSLGGVIFYGFYDEKIHIDYSIRTMQAPIIQEFNRSLTFFYSHNDSIIAVTKICTINTIDNDTTKNIINLWLSDSLQHNPKLQKIMCNSLIIKNSLYYCSFTETPFNSSTSLFEKYSFFEGLLKTLFELNPSLKGVVFLINHKAFEDMDLDFSLPWSPHLVL